MNLSDFQSKFQEITKSLSKAKVSAEIRVMIDTLIMFVTMMFEFVNKLIVQNEEQSKDNESLRDTIKDLQSTIKELQRQLGLNSQNSSKPP